LNEARDYREHGDDYERGQHRDFSLSTPDLWALRGVLVGRVPLLAHVDRAADIEELISLQAEYGIRVIISGGAEAWMLAPHIAAANIPVILAPTANLPSNFDRLNASVKSAAILSDAGVTIAFADGESQTHNARNITQSAGNASAEGLSWDAALRAITLSPAEMYGVADQVGSIELGKDADIVIWPGDPLELTNYPEQVFIKGESVDMVSRQTLLRDRYLDTEDTRPPAYRN
jgi:imidazolonepropionase-like amidohydrolase